MENQFFNDKAYNGISYSEVSRIDGDCSVLTLEQANILGHDILFDSLVTQQEGWETVDSIPLTKTNVQHVVIPYCYENHHKVIFEDTDLETKIETFANGWLSDQKYLLSCNNNIFFAVKLKKFNYDQVDTGLESGGWNSDFILFDETYSRWFVFYSRFPFITISWTSDTKEEKIIAKSNAFWRDYFSKHISLAVEGESQGSIDFYNKNYMSKFDGYDLIIKH